MFLDALAGWQQRVIAQLEIAVEDAKTGRNYTTSLTLPKPVDHTSDYDQAIAMLKMEVSASVKIDNRTFSQLVMDDWGWKEDFLSTASLYLEHN